MRGSDKNKNILMLNNEVKRTTMKLLIVYNIIIILLYYYYKVSPIAYFCFTALELLAFYMISQICAPMIVKENGVNKLVKVVSSSASGTVSFCWDVLFYTILTKALFVLNWKWIIICFGIPVSFFIEFFYKPYKRLKLNKSE